MLTVWGSYSANIAAKTTHCRIIPGSERLDCYLPKLANKRIAIMSNHTGMIKDQHLVDVLIKEGVNVTAIFSPEHGFRGNADAGEIIKTSIDKKTGIPILSLYDKGKSRPSDSDMDKFDVMIIDIQDVGLRFYTYYITMVKLMDACAEFNKEMLILDRPNPNGHYVDGPILDMNYKSGVGWLPIPVVHGMTLGELALMTNGEGWLKEGRKCKLEVVKCINYSHKTFYTIPIAPSPNLPNMRSIYLYPSTCLFEGTIISLGRGTDFPFQVYGHPDMKDTHFKFTPRSIPGAKNPPLLNQECNGVDLRTIPEEELQKLNFNLEYIIDAYTKMGKPEKFFTSFFEKLVGVDYIRKMIIAGENAETIRKRWKKDVEKFKIQRKPYLLYKE